MARTKIKTTSTRTKVKPKPALQLTLSEVKAFIEKNLHQQRRAYEEGLPGDNGEKPEAVPAKIDVGNWLDAEHLDGTIRSLISERKHLATSVGICPVYNADAIKEVSANAALNKVLAHTSFQTKRHPGGDIILDREVLPEPRFIFNDEVDKIKEIDEVNSINLKQAFAEYVQQAEELNDSLLAFGDEPETPLRENESLTQKITDIETQIQSLGAIGLKEALFEAVDALEDKLRQIDEHKRQDQILNLEAQQLLANNHFTEETLFLVYLEAVVDSEQGLLGNPRNPALSFYETACNQLIIPFRQNNNHYTVAVAHMYKEDGEQIAHIKYYDSMGGDLNENLLVQLMAFFERKKFKVEYEGISNRESRSDQRDGYNCAIFASHKSIDIANENVGNAERLLAGLNDENYDQRLNYYRYVVALKLREIMGHNISPAEELEKYICERQSAFVKLSKKEAQLDDLKRLLKDIAKGLEKVLNKVTLNVKPQKSDTSTLPYQDANGLFNACDELCNEMHDILKQKKALEKKSEKDNKDIQALIAGIQSFKSVRGDLQNELKRLLKIIATGGQTNGLPSWFVQPDWKVGLVYGFLGGAGLYVGLPYLLSFAAGITFSSPFVYMGLGAGAFALGGWLINEMGSYITGEPKKITSEENKLDAMLEGLSLEGVGKQNENDDVVVSNVVELRKPKAVKNLLPLFDVLAKAENESSQTNKDKGKVEQNAELRKANKKCDN